MGFLDGLRGSPERLERKGDEALVARDPLGAMRAYRDALAKAQKQVPEAVERLRKKVVAARRALVSAKIAEARMFLEDEVLDAADEAIEIARDQLEAEDAGLRDEVMALKQRIGRLIVERDAPGETPLAAPPAQAEDEAPPLPGTAPSGAATLSGGGEEDDPGIVEGSLDVLFDQLSAGLADEDREHGLQLGAAFHAGFLALQQGDTTGARTALQQAHSEHPEDALVLEYLARSLDASGDTAGALEQYRAALSRDPRRMHSRLALAGVLAGVEVTGGAHAFAHWSGDPARREPNDGLNEALALLAEGARVDPGNAAAYSSGSADLCLAGGRPAEAVRHLAGVIERGAETDPSVWHSYAVALEMSGDLDAAEEAFRRAVALSGASMFFRAEFAEFALRHGRVLQEAETMIFETCIGCQASLPSVEQMDLYGVLLTRLQLARGELKAALEGVGRLLAKGPPHPLAQQLRGLGEEIRRRMNAGGADAPEP